MSNRLTYLHLVVCLLSCVGFLRRVMNRFPGCCKLGGPDDSKWESFVLITVRLVLAACFTTLPHGPALRLTVM